MAKTYLKHPRIYLEGLSITTKDPRITDLRAEVRTWDILIMKRRANLSTVTICYYL
jgi:hypothetical protein